MLSGSLPRPGWRLAHNRALQILHPVLGPGQPDGQVDWEEGTLVLGPIAFPFQFMVSPAHGHLPLAQKNPGGT